MLSTNINKYKLFNENNLDFMKRLPASSIDLILTDPPYNIAPFSRGNIHLNNGRTILIISPTGIISLYSQ